MHMHVLKASEAAMLMVMGDHTELKTNLPILLVLSIASLHLVLNLSY